MLSADFGRLFDEAVRVEKAGADALHLDIMDGHFVPNLSFGTNIVSTSKKAVKIPLDVHLMLSNPDRYVDRFMDAGADWVSIHIEADCDVAATLKTIRDHKVLAGLVLKPKTPAEALAPYLGQFDYVLCMTVEPGYGGQSFMSDMLPKIRAVAELSRKTAKPFPVMVDGGINNDTGALCAAAGATQLVSGSTLFKAPDLAEAIAGMREKAEKACEQA